MIPALQAVADAAMAARPITLCELQARAELMARVDHSYLVPVEVFADFAARLTDPHRPGGPFQALCINGRRWFGYHSVYYDTLDLRSFHDHRQGRRNRYKIRERLYEHSGERQFEIKLKGRRGETDKRRRPLLPDEATLGRGPRDFLATVLHGTYGIAAPGELVPSLVTDYQRATFVTDGRRITCDAGLVCQDAGTGRSVRADEDVVLVETKTAVTGHLTEADRLLHTYGLRAVQFTKYCGAMAALRPGLKANKWGRAVRTVFPQPAT
ncbi:polyphosphate polymerase domain-containing protein [Streptomyces rimosus]|uniref:polyphosphate polymerase domain-containing protein n=1 Tax=Streptomyces rimosus TaxID=1927 RepID=UPI0037B9F697